MANVQKGTIGGVFGVKATSITVAAGTHEIIRTYNYSKTAKDKELAEGDGDICNKTFYDPREQMTVDIIVTADSQANALLDFIKLPAPGDPCVVTSVAAGKDTQIHGINDVAGDLQWNVLTASKVATCDDYGTMTLTLERCANDMEPRT